MELRSARVVRLVCVAGVLGVASGAGCSKQEANAPKPATHNATSGQTGGATGGQVRKLKLKGPVLATPATEGFLDALTARQRDIVFYNATMLDPYVVQQQQLKMPCGHASVMQKREGEAATSAAPLARREGGRAVDSAGRPATLTERAELGKFSSAQTFAITYGAKGGLEEIRHEVTTSKGQKHTTRERFFHNPEAGVFLGSVRGRYVAGKLREVRRFFEAGPDGATFTYSMYAGTRAQKPASKGAEKGAEKAEEVTVAYRDRAEVRKDAAFRLLQGYVCNVEASPLRWRACITRSGAASKEKAESVEKWSYDEAGRLTRKDRRTLNREIAARTEYTYDAKGKLTSYLVRDVQQKTRRQRKFTVEYDAKGRLARLLIENRGKKRKFDEVITFQHSCPAPSP